MDVSTVTWVVTLAAVLAVYMLDFAVAARNPHIVSPREAAAWVVVYVALAAAFATGVGLLVDWRYAGQFVAGYLTEYSLSVDNLFVFVLIMSSFAVPRVYQQKVLQLGILGALVLRFAFIMIGAAAINRFSWVFYVFGAFLLYTAGRLLVEHGGQPDPTRSRLLRIVERTIPSTREYVDGRFVTRVDGRRVVTPLFVVIFVIFMTDLLFAVDSIPAIFGLTQESYIVFTANAFALMGLRQMYFLLDGVLDRLVYLTYGLATILSFIGVKLVLHALHGSGLDVPEIGTAASLLVIVTVMAVTVVASLVASARNPAAVVEHDLTGHHHPEGQALEDLRRSRRDAPDPGGRSGG